MNLNSIEIHWQDGVFGALLGLIFPYLLKIFVYIQRLLENDYLIGDWFCYFGTNEKNDFEIVEVKWSIKKGINSKYIIKETRTSISDVEYRENIHLYRDLIGIEMEGVTHAEKSYVTLFNPIPKDGGFTSGLGLSLDFSGLPTTRAFVLSKKAIKKEVIENIMASKYIILNKYSLTRALKN